MQKTEQIVNKAPKPVLVFGEGPNLEEIARRASSVSSCSSVAEYEALEADYGTLQAELDRTGQVLAKHMRTVAAEYKVKFESALEEALLADVDITRTRCTDSINLYDADSFLGFMFEMMGISSEIGIACECTSLEPASEYDASRRIVVAEAESERARINAETEINLGIIDASERAEELIASMNAVQGAMKVIRQNLVSRVEVYAAHELTGWEAPSMDAESIGEHIDAQLVVIRQDSVYMDAACVIVTGDDTYEVCPITGLFQDSLPYSPGMVEYEDQKRDLARFTLKEGTLGYVVDASAVPEMIKPEEIAYEVANRIGPQLTEATRVGNLGRERARLEAQYANIGRQIDNLSDMEDKIYKQIEAINAQL